MTDTISDATTRVLRHLDDEESEVWSRNDVDSWVQDGYDKLVRLTEAIYEMQMFTNEPLAANHTRPCEEEFMTGQDFPIMGIFNFTKESEREYAVASAAGPSNHTTPAHAAYATTPTARTLGKLTEGYVSVDRVTHDWLRLDPEHSRYLRETRSLYETMQGGVFSYSMEQDGIFNLRTVGVPVATINPITTTLQINGVKQHGAVFGIIRQEDTTEVGTDPIVGQWGIMRSTPQHFPIGGPWGLMRLAIDDTTNTRVELFRLGRPLEASQPFEIPSRCVKYVEFWAMYRAYGEDTPGNDPVLSAHYLERFKIGVQRLTKRVQGVMDERTIHLGGKRNSRQADSYLAHFPTNMGYPHKYGR